MPAMRKALNLVMKELRKVDKSDLEDLGMEGFIYVVYVSWAGNVTQDNAIDTTMGPSELMLKATTLIMRRHFSPRYRYL